MRITLKSSTKEFVDQELEVPDDLSIHDLLDAVQKRFLLTADYGLATIGPGSRVFPPNQTLSAAGLRTGMIVQMVVTGRRYDSVPPSSPLPPTAEMPAPSMDLVNPQFMQPPAAPQPTQPPATPQTIVETPPPPAPAPAAQADGMRTMIDMPIPAMPPPAPPKPALSDTLQEIVVPVLPERPQPPSPPQPAPVVNIWMEPAPTDSQVDIPLGNTLVDAPMPTPDPKREVTKRLDDVPQPGEMYVSKPQISYPPPGMPIPTVADPLASLPPSPAPIPATSVPTNTPPEFQGFGPSVHSALLAEDGQVFRLSQPLTIIGRPGKAEHGNVDVDLSILDPNKSTSRPHARIELRKGHFYIRDLMSSNGVLVNKIRITPAVDAALQDGDKLQFGNVRLTFRVVQAAR